MFRRLICERLEVRWALAVDLFAESADGLWGLRPQIPASQGGQSFIQPTAYSTIVLDADNLARRLETAPLEFSTEAWLAPLEITLPTPDHGFSRFAVMQSPIMEPALAAQFPEIRTYRGQGIDDPAATLRFDLSPVGFHAQVLSPSGAYYIDPFWHLDDSVYISYFKRDLVRRSDMLFSEEMHEDLDSKIEVGPSKSVLSPSGKEGELTDENLRELTIPEFAESELLVVGDGPTLTKDPGSTSLLRSGSQLRTYRLANAATGEYTAFHGGTTALGQAAIVTAINRVTGIYENELSVRLVLVGNNSSLVYTNAATDPYTNSDPSALLSQNQSNIDSVIGNANYDIGHVFSTGGGGLAGLGVVGVTGQKARGETGLGSPVGDAFYVDYVAHEMGHQFGGDHTFNGTQGNCSGGNRNAATAYEPGSGSTIQAYAGICGSDNLQTTSDPYFHSVSFDQIFAYTTTGIGNSAAAISSTGNSVPRIRAGSDFVIPARTPFALNAAGADSDAADSLSYNWEQRDLGPAQAVGAADNGTSPLFRSVNPTSNPERIIPRLSDLLNNTTSVGEKLPTTTRTLKFRATVRDNRSGGGGLNTDDMQISVVDTGSGFAVTSPNTLVNWAGNSTQSVTWNVAGTTAAPINTANVNIWLSTNGGISFPILLAANTLNDGIESVTIPNITAANARIKVESANSIFFDVSNVNFSITGSSNTPPTISSIVNQLLDTNGSTGALPFTIGDTQTAASSLVVSATSSNTTLVPIGSILLGGSGANRTITVTPAPGQFGQTTISVSVADESGLTVQDTFVVFVDGVLTCSAYESFDNVSVPTLPAGWSSTASGVAANWVTSNASSFSGPNNVFVPNPNNIGESLLTTPSFTVSQANNQIRFRNSYNLETSFDGGVLEISINGGAFVDLVTAGGTFVTNGYNATLSSQYGNPLSGRQAWTGNSSGYLETVADLPLAAMGASVQLRWRLGSDNSASLVGWRIDSVQRCGFALPNLPPSAMVLSPSSASLAEDSNTSVAIALSTVSVVDDGLGMNVFSLTGVDANSFELVGNQLRLRAGVSLNFEAKSSYLVTVNVDDPTVGGAPDQSMNFVLTVTDVNEMPSISASVSQITGNVLAPLLNSGTWSDPESGTVTLSASLGAVTKNSDGTWSWEYTSGAAINNQNVTVTATDMGNLVATASFSITAQVAVSGRRVFYKGSAFVSQGGVETALDSSKTLLKSSALQQSTTFENVSNYTLGLNGIVLDVAGLANSTLTSSDFIFRVAPAGSIGMVAPSTWNSAPTPSLIDVTPGTGTTAARVRLEWPDNAIQDTWLQIVVQANANTGLLNREVYYVGHATAEINGVSPYRVTAAELSAVQIAISNTLLPSSDLRDINKDRRVTAADLSFVQVRISNTILLNNIVIPASGSSAEGESGRGGQQRMPSLGGHALDAVFRNLGEEPMKPDMRLSNFDPWKSIENLESPNSLRPGNIVSKPVEVDSRSGSFSAFGKAATELSKRLRTRIALLRT